MPDVIIGWLHSAFHGVRPQDWWGGFAGAFCSVLFSAALTLIVVRLQRNHDRSLVQRQIDAEKANTLLQIEENRRRDEEAALETAYAETTRHLLAMADRTRRYTERPYYDEAVRDQKQWNLLNDCRRELANLIPMIRDGQLRETLLRVPSAFEQFAEHFSRRVEAEKRGQRVPDPRVWSSEIRSYIATIVEEITRCRSGERSSPPISAPSISYE